MSTVESSRPDSVERMRWGPKKHLEVLLSLSISEVVSKIQVGMLLKTLKISFMDS